MERQVRAQYTADYKAQAVSLAESLGAAKAARKLGIQACAGPQYARRDVQVALAPSVSAHTWPPLVCQTLIHSLRAMESEARARSPREA